MENPLSVALSPKQNPTILVAVALGFLGLGFRWWDLGFPPELTWDEHHFVNNARNYLGGRPDWNDHPPLGKLLIALGITALGDTATGFRFSAALFGSLSIPVAGWLARSVFRSNLAAFLAAAFVAADGFLIAYSRTALLDGVLTALSLSTLLLLSLPGTLPLLASGVALGLAMSVKVSAIALLGPMLALTLARTASHTKLGSIIDEGRKLSLFGRPLLVPKLEIACVVPALGLCLAVYLGCWMWGLALTGQEASVSSAIDATEKMMKHHAALTDWKHPLLSRWWTWAIPVKPILLRHEPVDLGVVRALTMMGNPILWWAVTLTVLGTLLGLLRWRRYDLGPFWLLLAFVAYLSPWILTERDSYIYHYLPCYAIGLVLVAGRTAHYFHEGARRAVLVFTCAVALVTAYYAPVWAQMPISESALDLRPLIR